MAGAEGAAVEERQRVREGKVKAPELPGLCGDEGGIGVGEHATRRGRPQGASYALSAIQALLLLGEQQGACSWS
jgi:hypothetical protein